MDDGIKTDDLLMVVMLAVVIFLSIKLLPRIMAGVPFARPRDLKERLDRRDDVLILDVRNPGEFTDDLGHIPGALNLPLSSLSGRLEQIRPSLEPHADTPVYVVCRTANRAANAARLLKKAGLKDIRVLEGGMVRWKREGMPSTKSA